MSDIESVARDPGWLPHRYDPQRRTIRFVRLDRAGHRAATFLDDEYLKNVTAQRDVTVDVLLRAGLPAQPIHFVFHTAFCCSTLLARALDIEGAAFGYKEPKILNDLAFTALQGRLDRQALDLALTLLARPFATGEVNVVKPGNEANILIDAMLDLRPAARALLLSSALDDFLLSVAKKGMWGRLWARRLYAQLAPRQRRPTGFSGAETFGQTDLQIAALLWCFQRAQFDDLAARLPDRVRGLDASVMLARPAVALKAVASLFGVDLSPARAEAVVASGAFREHSKELGRSYDPAQRAGERAAMQAAHGEEIGMVVTWAEAVATHIGVPMTLPRPLFG